MGTLFATIGAHMPPPPDFAEPPVVWGSEGLVRGLPADAPLELRLRRELLQFPPVGSLDEDVEMMITALGPLMMARRLLEPQGRWPAPVDDLRALPADEQPAEHLVTRGRRDG